MFRPDHIVIHHSASKDGNTFDANTIKGMHLAKGWSDVGYHALVDNVGGEFSVILGRPITKMGAQAKGFNGRSLGICFIGNYELTEPDSAMIKTAVDDWIAPMSLLLNIHPDRIIAHRDAPKARTVCPGKYFPMNELKAQVKKYWR